MFFSFGKMLYPSGSSLTYGARLVPHLTLAHIVKVKEQKEAAELWYVSIRL